MNRTVTPTLSAQRNGFHDVLNLPRVRTSSASSDRTGSSTSRAGRTARSTALLSEAAAVTDPTERRRLHEEVVALHSGLARAIASRYRSRGLADDDLDRAAADALLRAAVSFDPSDGVEFLAYALVTVKAEVELRVRDAR